MKEIFLSHSWDDKPFVRKIAHGLETAGFRVWLDEAEIKVGDSLIGKITDAIDHADFVAAFLSTKSVTSSWVQKELEIAMTQEISGNNVKVLPILVEKCELPAFLINKLYADFTNPTNFESSFAHLVNALGGTARASVKRAKDVLDILPHRKSVEVVGKQAMTLGSWVAHETEEPQGVDRMELPLNGERLRSLSFQVTGATAYWRAGIKLEKPQTGVESLPLVAADSVLIHVSRNHDSSLAFVGYKDGANLAVKPIVQVMDDNIVMSFRRKGANYLGCTVNGELHYQLECSAQIFERAYLVAWGDGLQYETSFAEISYSTDVLDHGG